MYTPSQGSLLVVLGILLSNHCLGIPPGDGYFYSTHGWYNNTCEVSQCLNTCNIGQYLSGCSGNNTGACESCNNGPEFSSYTNKGALISDCDWVCSGGYILSGNSCIQDSLCNKEIPPYSSYSDSNYPNCDHQCNAGYYGALATNPPSCNLCLAGTYSLRGATVCTLCPAGTFSTVVYSPSSANCEKCAAGTYSANAGANLASVCVQCAAGTYSLQGAITCVECPAGTSSGVQGANSASLCASCSTGKYTATTGRIACVNCNAGTYAANVGTTKCAVCTPDTYSPLPGASACLACQYCTTNGLYKSQCGPVSAGGCVSCTMPP
jgi:hypothetical protein